MTFRGFLSAALVSVCWVFVSATQTALNVSAPLAPTASTSNTGNSTQRAGTSPPREILKSPGVNSSMIQRALYVLIGFTMIGVLYFLIRAVRLKKPAQKKKKYGLLSNYDDSVEMEAVESDEDDTLYEARSLRR